MKRFTLYVPAWGNDAEMNSFDNLLDARKERDEFNTNRPDIRGACAEIHEEVTFHLPFDWTLSRYRIIK